MAESLFVDSSADKAEKYRQLLPQLSVLTEGEDDLTANLANIAAALKEVFNFFWVGFYIVQKNELVLGPFQGPIACTRITKGRGVCGSSWERKETIIVDDVEKFPGHIACSAESRSEIVVPVLGPAGDIVMVIDADSNEIAHFDDTDKLHLEELAIMISKLTRKGNNSAI